MTNQKRTPAGVPTGGQFATNEHDEASAGLGDDYSLSTALRDSENGYVKALVARFDEDGIENSEDRQDLARQWYRDLENDEDEENAPGLGLSTEEREQAGDELRKFSEFLMSDRQRLRYGVGTVVVSLNVNSDDDDEDASDTLNEIADSVESGNTSGHYPTWEVAGKDLNDPNETVDVRGNVLIVELDGNRAEDTMRHIADQIADGNTSGYYPAWELRSGTHHDAQSGQASDIAGMLSYSSIEDDGDDKLVVVRDPSLPDVYVISVDEDGNTSSAHINKEAYAADREEALREADWDTGFDA